MADYITTYTGKHMIPTDPRPEDFRIEDIAHALSLICRGNGQVKTFFSVGQHCIACAKEAAARDLPQRIILACLLHDAGESYLSDVPRPFKKTQPAYQELENRILSMIYTKFLGSDLTEQETALVKEIDDIMLWYDLKTLLNEVQSELPGEPLTTLSADGLFLTVYFKRVLYDGFTIEDAVSMRSTMSYMLVTEPTASFSLTP